MKTTLTETAFKDAFQSIRPDNFSYAGLCELYEWLESYEEDTGQEYELDVIALCCDFSEYTLEELKNSYGYMFDKDDMPETLDDWTEVLGNHTFVIPVHYRNSISPNMAVDSLIVQGF